jgi:outer membrane protein assembly factor BamB
MLAVALCVSATAARGADTTGQAGAQDAAQEILDAAGISGGLIVHLGCGDGKVTAALHADDAYVVHGLDVDAESVRKARAHIQELGIYGPVSVDRFDGKRLPYADNLVNVVVGEDLGDVASEEAMRVLAPGGAVCVRQDGRWRKSVKPRPGDIDTWTHYLHDASGNAVAHDDVVGPPGRIQWTAAPRHTRSHEHIPSIYALVSTGPRIFYICDQGPIASVKQMPQWHLAARDAFNGILLWEKPIDRWFPHIVNWGQTPRELQRKLVAVEDRVYVTLGLHAPLSAMDAATGETLKVYEETGGTEEILLHQGTLLLVVRSVTEEQVAELEKWERLVAEKGSPVDSRDSAEPLVRRLRTSQRTGEIAVLALDADTGSVLWKKSGGDVSGLRTCSLCADGDRVFYQAGRDVVCLDLKTGRERWSKPFAPLSVVCGDNVFCADGDTVTALSAETGEPRWEQDSLLCNVRDVFVAGGSLWLGGFKPYQGRRSGKRGPAWGPYFATQRDLATGKVLMHVEPENPGHHHRCYRNKATDRYIFGGRRGTELIDLKSGEVRWHSWARGVCRYGVMPSNGLLYVPPHACGCYMTAKLTGFNALAPMQQEAKDVSRETPRMVERGPAFDSPLSGASSARVGDWPAHRHDARRSGGTASAVPAALRRRWQEEVGAKLTSPTIADGKVIVASVDEHRISARDADSGQPVWHFTAGARVDSPPTLYRGRAIFGCRDGYVYSVRTSDGALAWRVRAAREDRRITARGQLESVWPVIGSVLIVDDVVYCTAGRSSYLDGGIDLFRLDPAAGKILSRKVIYSPDPETGRQPEQFAPSAMPGSRADILSADDTYLYLQDAVFDKQGAAQPETNPHLFAMTGFLDDSWPHRSYWIFGKKCSVSTGCSGRDRDLIYGRLLVFDESTIYGYGRANVHWSNQLEDGSYRLFAVKRGEGSAQWAEPVPVLVRAMVLADDTVFLAGSPAHASVWSEGQEATREGLLVAVSASDGSVLARHPLDAPPVFDGMAAAGRRLYLALEDGQVVCMGE